MKKRLKNLLYIIRHKWFVLRAGLELGVPLTQLLLHDLSKLLPSEFFPYADKFFSGDTRPRQMHEPGERLRGGVEAWGENQARERFDRAWLLHLRRNSHHFQSWLAVRKDGSVVPLEMPWRFAREMVADWIGAAKAQGNHDRRAVLNWYSSNKRSVIVHGSTRALVEHLLRKYARGGPAPDLPRDES